LRLTLDAPDALVVRAVEGGVEQMIDNLISNAMAVSPPESKISITASATEQGGGQLVVADEGPGMPADERRQATARFWRSPGNSTEGSGLGLSIVDHLALAGGGQLSLDAGPGG